MVRPGLINLDFADVETVMSSMGKAMMGTGEAEGENRAIAATEMALNNPLIDDYSLKGAKGLLVNITGGEDIKLFEVDQSVNKIRAEVDPEAELIFGAIKDEKLNGKMRVSIVATALDGEEHDTKTFSNNVHRIYTRQGGYVEEPQKNLGIPSMPDLTSIQGATALKLNDEISERQNSLMENQPEENVVKNEDQIVTGISLENATYFENDLNNNISQKEEEPEETVIDEISLYEEKKIDNPDENIKDEVSPQLFSDEEINNASSESNTEEFLKSEEEEDFEIPAFLRKQKF